MVVQPQKYIEAINARIKETKSEGWWGNKFHKNGYIWGLQTAIKIIKSVYKKAQEQPYA